MTEEIDQDVSISWSKIISELKKSLDKDTFQNWIKPIQFESLLDTSLTLSVPTRFLRDWIIKNYASVIKRAYLDQGITINKLSILVKENNNRVIPGTEVVHQDKEEDGDDHYYDDDGEGSNHILSAVSYMCDMCGVLLFNCCSC